MPRGRLRYPHLVNWKHPLNRGLVGWWLAVPQWLGGNTFRDLCGRNHGTLVNGPTWGGAGGCPGSWGRVNYDGIDDEVTIPRPARLTYANPFTCALWIRRTSGTDLKGFLTIQEGSDISTRLVTAYFYDAANGLLVARGPTAPVGSSQPATAIVQSAWNRLVFTVPGGDVRPTIYVNGQLNDANNGTALSPWGTDVITLGRGIITDFYAACQIDDVRVLDRAWSLAEVRLDYQLSRQGYPGLLNRVQPARWFVPEAAAVASLPPFRRPWRVWKKVG